MPWNLTAYPCTVTNCTSADAMLVRYDAGISGQKKVMRPLQAGTGNNVGGIDLGSSPQSWTVTSIRTPWPLIAVHKVGRTTGWTSGPITQTCINWFAKSGGASGQQIEEVCVQEVQARADAGDSGSPVLESLSTTSAAAQGIEFGNFDPGFSGQNWLFYYVAWAPIQTRLGLTLTPY